MPDRQAIARLLAALPSEADPETLQALTEAVGRRVRAELEHGRLAHRRGHPALALDLQYRQFPELHGLVTETTKVLRQLQYVYRVMPDGMDLAFDEVPTFSATALSSPRGDLDMELADRWSDGESEISRVNGDDWAFPQDDAGFYPKVMREFGGRWWWLLDRADSPAYERVHAEELLMSPGGGVAARRIDVTRVETRLLDPRSNGYLNADTDFAAVAGNAPADILRGLLEPLDQTVARAPSSTIGEALSDLLHGDPGARGSRIAGCRFIATSYYKSFYDLWLFHPRGAL